MKFKAGVKSIHQKAIEEAVETILKRGNAGHVEAATRIAESDVLIDFVPLEKIGCSGVTGLIHPRATNRRIDAEEFDEREALGEVYIQFADWTFDTAGQRGCQGTLVHEGLHACDFARIISSFSRSEVDPISVTDMTLYELEHRAAVACAEYVVLVGEPDYVDEGRQLSLVGLDADGKPFVDMEGIKFRMQNGYGLNENEQGTMISKMIGVRQKGAGSMLSKLIGLVP